MRGLGDVSYDDFGNITSDTGSYYNPTQQFGTLDSQGNLIPYGSSPQWGVTTPPFFGGGSYGSGGTPGFSNFWNAITKGLTSATSILGVRYAVPQLNPGQTISVGPGGTSFMSQAAAGGALQVPSSIGGINLGTILLIGGGVLIFSLMSKRR
jgi:hypothetical protein